MAFSNIENSEKLDIINIAIVNNEDFDNNNIFKEVFKTLSDKDNKDRLFDTKYVSEEEAKELLQDDEISGYMLLEKNNPKVVFRKSGIDETIFKYVVEEITQTAEIINNLSEKQIEEYMLNANRNELENINDIYTNIYKEVLDLMENSNTNIENVSSNNLSYTMIEFYTLIAMSCLYGGMLGMVAVNQNLANMSSNGKRTAVSPTSKSKVILSSLLASYLVQLIGLSLLFLYTIFALKVDYGLNLPLIILLGFIGSFAGLSMGLMVGTVFKSSENTKTGILLAITMTGCFLSGMMGITMKYIVDKNIPLLNKINPASMITDGFYSLYYYDTLDRYFFNIASLIIFAFVMILISYLSLRRRKYDSI